MTLDVLVPASADEAATMYGDGKDITVFAGGTILLPEIAAGRLKPNRAMMLHKSGLDQIRVESDRVVIGAMVTVAALTDAPDDVLSQVALHIADGEVRRNATLGGNISSAPAADSQRGDLGGALIALGARVRSTGASGERTEPIEDFLTGDRAGRLVLDVEYERFERRSGGTGLRRRHAHSFAIAGVTACARADGSDLRIAVTGVGPTAIRCRTVEQSRNGDDVLKDVTPVDDAVASAAYRSAVLPKLVTEALDHLEHA